MRVIVPFALGGAARTHPWPAPGADLGQPVIIENVAGAVGATQIARAAPDSASLFVGTGSVNSALPSVKSDYGANFASSGIGSSIHLAGELFKLQTQTEMTHVPYKGSTPAMADLLAGHVDLMFDNLTNVMPNIEADKVRVLGVAGAKRTPYLPNVPTIAKSVPNFEATTWVGFLAPVGAPQDIVDQIAANCDRSLREAAIVERVMKLASEPVGDAPSQFATFLKADNERSRRVVKDANLTVE